MSYATQEKPGPSQTLFCSSDWRTSKYSFSSSFVPGKASLLKQEPKNLSTYFSPFTEVNNKKKVLAICLLSLVLVQFTLFVMSFSGMRPAPIFTPADDFVLRASGFVGGTALGAIVDTVLALSIVVLLRRHRSKVPFSRTSSMIDRIMMYTVGSGLLIGS